MKILAMLVLACGLAGAQSVPASALPQNWAGAGASFTNPGFSGWISMAKLISASNGLYSYSSYDAIAKPGALPTLAARSGLASKVFSYGNFFVLGFGTAGVAQTSSAITGSFSGGGMAFYKLKSGLTIELGARVVNGTASRVYEFGLGKAWN